MGATTPLGGDLAIHLGGLLAGAVRRQRHPERRGPRTCPSGSPRYVEVDPSEMIDRVKARRLDRSAQLALVAAEEAWADAGFGLGEENTVDPDRLGVVAGHRHRRPALPARQLGRPEGEGPAPRHPLHHPHAHGQRPRRERRPARAAPRPASTPRSRPARPRNEAIALAVDQIRLGRADVVVAGGTEATIHPLPIAAFAPDAGALASATTTRRAASRPWDKGRDGFVLGEGAAVHGARDRSSTRRPAAPRIYGTVAGAGITADSHDIVAARPDGRRPVPRDAQGAARDAGCRASDIKHVNAHGTSTPQGDVDRGRLDPRGARRRRPTTSSSPSTKSMTGHLLGAAGALETIATVLALHDRVVPPTINLDDPEHGLGIDIAANVPRPLPAGDLAALNNSFGFGGHNVAVVVHTANAS